MPGMKEAFKKIRSLGESFVDASKAGDAVDQIVAAFETLAKLYARMMEETKNERADLKKKFDESIKSLTEKIDGHFNKMQHGPMGPKGDKGEPGLGVPGIRGEKGKDGRDGSSDSPEQVRDKLKMLKGNERLDMKAIKGLSETIGLLEEKVNKKVVHVPVGGGGGDTGGMKVYNISSSLNGVLKTFSLPAVAEIFFVLSTSAPSPAMISSEDFTMDFTTMEITFGASIDAATTLAAGQRILVCYA